MKFFLKFSGSSAVCFLVDNGLFTLLNLYVCAGLPDMPRYIVATYVARAVSSVTNFLLNRCVVFQAKNPLGRAALRYLILCVVQAGISALLVYVITNLTLHAGWIDTCIKIGVDMFLFLISYHIQKHWVFRAK